jgi:hypothetical protein
MLRWFPKEAGTGSLAWFLTVPAGSPGGSLPWFPWFPHPPQGGSQGTGAPPLPEPPPPSPSLATLHCEDAAQEGRR